MKQFQIVISLIIVTLLLPSIATAKGKGEKESNRPNVVLIMADDMGYEAIGINGSTQYSTPNIDRIAQNGVQFTNCISQPLCTPSRVKIMTGKYNFRNYEYFGYLNDKETTFGHVMQRAGYRSCIVGKWQLNGRYSKNPQWDDKERPFRMGFDEFALWQVTSGPESGERFAHPNINTNGVEKRHGIDDYGPDIFSNYAIGFIERCASKNEPFFLYYPMVLVHNPFVPTPDSPEWSDRSLRYKRDNHFFSDMVTYTDKIVGNIEQALKDNGVYENTILIFTADNGTNVAITSKTKDRVVKGAKGNTITDGTHVPLVISWPSKMTDSAVYNELISLADFMPTLAEIADQKVDCDGHSLLTIIGGDLTKRTNREVMVHYDPMWGRNVNRHRDRFAMTVNYKLYQDGKFFNITEDVLEKSPIDYSSLNRDEQKIYRRLQKRLDSAPEWDEVGKPRPAPLH